MRKFYVGILLFIFCNSYSQMPSRYFADSIRKDWIQSNKEYNVACDSFYYSNAPDMLSIERVMDFLRSDSSIMIPTGSMSLPDSNKFVFSEEERKYLVTELGKQMNILWPNNYFSKSRVIDSEGADPFIRSKISNGLNSLDKLCFTVFVFSRPIYFRNDRFCIFYSGKVNFAIKEGEFWLFRRNGSMWEKYIPIYRWIE